MRFRVEAPVEATVEELYAVALDADAAAALPAFMPLLESVARVEHTQLGDGRVRIVDRYAPAFDPPPFARGLTRESLGWDLVLTWDPSAFAAEFVIEPKVKPEWRRHADAGGVYRFERRGDRSARVIEGDVVIRAGLVGSLAERFAVGQLTKQFEGEARLLGEWARRRRQGAPGGDSNRDR
ncbi:MAG: DUF2505 family protein [Polyangiales bacterium]